MKVHLSSEFKIEILEHLYSVQDIKKTMDKFNIDYQVLFNLFSNYEKFGIEGVISKGYIPLDQQVKFLIEKLIFKLPHKKALEAAGLKPNPNLYQLHKRYNIGEFNNPFIYSSRKDDMREDKLYTKDAISATEIFTGDHKDEVRQKILRNNPDVLLRYSVVEYLLNSEEKSDKEGACKYALKKLEELREEYKKDKDSFIFKDDLFSVYKPSELSLNASKATDIWRNYLKKSEDAYFNLKSSWGQQLLARWKNPMDGCTTFDLQHIVAQLQFQQTLTDEILKKRRMSQFANNIGNKKK